MVNPEIKLSDGLLIAGMTLSGYITAFAYEWGYAFYYEVPRELISLTLTQILIAIMAIFWFLGLIFYFSVVIRPLSSLPVSPPVQRSLSRLLFLLALVIGGLFVFRGRTEYLWIALVVLVWFVLLEFLFPLIVIRDKKTYGEKLEAVEIAEGGGSAAIDILATVCGFGPKISGVQAVHLLILPLGVVFLAFFLGLGEAVTQETYYVSSQKMDSVFLRFYGDTAVMHEYDPATKRLKGDFIVTKISEKQPLHFQKKKLGHLDKKKL